MNLPDFPTNGDLRLPEILQLAGLSVEAFALLMDVHPRTVRRWLAGDVPKSVALVAWFVVAGHVPRKGWHDWLFDQAGALWGKQSRFTKYQGINEVQLSDIGLLLSYGNDARRGYKDLVNENDRLRALLLAARIKAELPQNVKLFPGVSAESVLNSKKEGLL